MADEKWQKVREIFDSALRRKPEDRVRFVADACGGNNSLLAEVESLLASLDSADNFLETSAMASVADGFESPGTKLEKDRILGHYRIVRQIGAGGMGEVYLARDQTLDRQVAIKILNEQFGNDESNLGRFIREAKAASALNHPNILIIHEIGEFEGAHFIVSEYVEGETLRDTLMENALPLPEVLDILIQTSGALSTAHKAHLIHRDIKPENIMIRPDGYVKILDFGLAKLIEEENKPFFENGSPEENLTAKGVILGTVNYMSPEQAKGEDVDERTDIFSLGVLMYEMVAGTTPFAGASKSETFANLINAEHLPLSRFSPTLPGDLQRIVSKTLRKNKDDRFQTMKGLLADLKDLRDGLPSEEKIEKRRPRETSAVSGLRKKTRESEVQSTTKTPAPAYFRWAAPLGIVIVLAAAAFVGVQLWPRTPLIASEPAVQKRLTVGGGVTRAAISSDGRYAALVRNAAVIFFDLQTGDERVLVPAEPDIRILTLTFKPDGKAVYFGKRKVQMTPVTLYSIPVGGGEPTKILEDIYGWLSFSPDQKRIAFVRRYPELNEYNILTADADGSNIIKLASSQMPNRFEGGPAWSPEGRTILCPAIRVEGGFHFTIAKVDAATGAVQILPGERWTWVHNLVWLTDSKQILMTAQSEEAVAAQIWRLDTDTGAASKVTNDSFLYESLAGSADGRSFVTVKVRQNSHVWILDDQPLQITTGFDKYDGVDGIAWSQSGTIFYHSRANERAAIWQMQPDGSGAKEITPDAGGGFAVSPDGRFLVYERQDSDSMGLHLRDIAEGSTRALTRDMVASHPAFSPGGKSVLFSSYDKKLALSEVDVAGGDPKVVSNEFQAARAPAVSPSGRFTAFAVTRAQTGELQSGIAIIDNETKKVVSMLPIKSGLGSNYEKPTIQWSSDETELYFILIDLPSSISNLAKIRIADGTISKVTQFPDGRVFNFAAEPRGKRMAIARGTVERDASLIKIGGPL